MKHLRTLACIAEVARSGSIRRSAERLAITPSALTRKIQDFEEELGTPLFERLSSGMRLNAAGELVIRYVRDQVSDLERVRSQIADLSGVRRGHVALACSQAFAHDVVPSNIRSYRASHPLVSFTVLVRDHVHAVATLLAFEADLALVLQPPPAAEFQPLLTLRQPVCAVMSRDHPLAAEGPIRLRECLRYPIAMPDRSLSIRYLIDGALARSSADPRIAVESGSFEVLRSYVRLEHVVSFQIRAGVPADDPGLIAREIEARDIPPALVVLGTLRGRTLSVAALKFVDQLSRGLSTRFGDGENLTVPEA